MAEGYASGFVPLNGIAPERSWIRLFAKYGSEFSVARLFGLWGGWGPGGNGDTSSAFWLSQHGFTRPSSTGSTG